MTDKYESLLKLDKDKLIDIVKNFRQYGYDDQLRENAINVLADRGISKEQLQITGNIENKTYTYSNDLFASFLKNSKIAFVLYTVLFISRILMLVLPQDKVGLAWVLLTVIALSLLLYFVFLFKSFMNQNLFYKTIGQDYGTEGVMLYLLLGMPFYMFMFFYFRNQMKDKMKEIK